MERTRASSYSRARLRLRGFIVGFNRRTKYKAPRRSSMNVTTVPKPENMKKGAMKLKDSMFRRKAV